MMTCDADRVDFDCCLQELSHMIDDHECSSSLLLVLLSPKQLLLKVQKLVEDWSLSNVYCICQHMSAGEFW